MSNGLAATGSAKAGAMLFFAGFSKPPGESKCIGNAI